MAETETLQALLERTRRRASPCTRTVLRGRVSADEVMALINESKKTSVLCSVKRDGQPHVSWTDFTWAGGKLYAHAHPRSLCYRNLVRTVASLSRSWARGSRCSWREGRAWLA